MDIIPCPDCGRIESSDAVACPLCGFRRMRPLQLQKEPAPAAQVARETGGGGAPGEYIPERTRQEEDDDDAGRETSEAGP